MERHQVAVVEDDKSVGVHRPLGGGRCRGEHGRSGPGVGQCVRGASKALGSCSEIGVEDGVDPGWHAHKNVACSGGPRIYEYAHVFVGMPLKMILHPSPSMSQALNNAGRPSGP